MKTTILVYAFTFCLASLNALIPPPISTSYELAEEVVAALQHQSANDYAELLPTSQELAQLVEDNHELYGANVIEAKTELEKTYSTFTLPQMKKAFGLVIEEGKKKGIEWDKITLESVKFGATESVIDIIFNYKGAYYQIHLEQTLRIKGEWKATQFITLV